jgi:hypothetical protein
MIRSPALLGLSIKAMGEFFSYEIGLSGYKV